MGTSFSGDKWAVVAVDIVNLLFLQNIRGKYSVMHKKVRRDEKIYGTWVRSWKNGKEPILSLSTRKGRGMTQGIIDQSV